MLAWWIFGTLGSILCLGVAAFSTKKGAARLKRVRNKIKRGRARATKSAWSAHVRKRNSTKRGQRRAKRRKNDYRITYGHRRSEDDPTLTRRAGRAIRSGAKAGTDAARLKYRQHRDAKAARKADDPKPKILELVSDKIDGSRSTRSGATLWNHGGQAMGKCMASTERGTECQNLETIGPDGFGTGHCWIPAHIREVRKLQAQAAQRWAAEEAQAKAAKSGARSTGSKSSAGAKSSARSGDRST